LEFMGRLVLFGRGFGGFVRLRAAEVGQERPRRLRPSQQYVAEADVTVNHPARVRVGDGVQQVRHDG
jgi:hypothetical protein